MMNAQAKGTEKKSESESQRGSFMEYENERTTVRISGVSRLEIALVGPLY
jgi:hypothetical protein